MSRAWAVRNCFPAGPLRRGGIDPGAVQDLPYRGSGDLVAGLDEFALPAAVPPRWIIGRDADHEFPDRGGRPARRLLV